MTTYSRHAPVDDITIVRYGAHYTRLHVLYLHIAGSTVGLLQQNHHEFVRNALRCHMTMAMKLLSGRKTSVAL